MALVTAVFLTAGCAPERVPEVFAPTPAFEAYREALEAIDVPEAVVPPTGPPPVPDDQDLRTLPLSRRLVLDALENAQATVAFRTEGSGQVGVSVTSEPGGVVEVVDLFRINGEEMRHVAGAAEEADGAEVDGQQSVVTEGLQLRFESRRPAEYVLRVVPELLRSGVVHIEVQAEPD
jgi:hypothetical protein